MTNYQNIVTNSDIISFPLNLPSPEAERWWLEHKTQIFTSPLSGHEQRIALQSPRWRAEVVFPILKEQEARCMQVFVAQLQGAKKQFLYSPAHNRSANWCLNNPIVAAPPVDENPQQTAATKLYINLIRNSTEHQINAGDYFAIYSALGRSALHIVTKSWRPPPEGAQFTSIDISPPLRFDPIVDAEIELQKPQATMRLLNDTQARLLWRRGLIVDGITLALSEVL